MHVRHNFPILKPQHGPQKVEGQRYSNYVPSTHAHLSMNLQTLAAPTVPYLEDPHAYRMRRVHIPVALDTQGIEQSTLSSERASAMVSSSYTHHAMVPQTLQGPSALYLSADTQQAYLQSNPYYRCGAGQEVFHSNQHLVSANGNYSFSLERKQEIGLHSENAVQYWSLYWPTGNDVQNHGLHLPTTTNSL